MQKMWIRRRERKKLQPHPSSSVQNRVGCGWRGMAVSVIYVTGGGIPSAPANPRLKAPCSGTKPSIQPRCVDGPTLHLSRHQHPQRERGGGETLKLRDDSFVSRCLLFVHLQPKSTVSGTAANYPIRGRRQVSLPWKQRLNLRFRSRNTKAISKLAQLAPRAPNGGSTGCNQ